MNLYIMADLEGISGIYDREQVRSDQGTRYHEGRALLTKEINVCVEACKAAGAQKVYVRDCHGGGNNVLWSELTDLADCCIVGNTGQDRFPGLGDCHGVILLGYHAMAGTAEAILEHSMSSQRVQNYWINGRPAGEIAIDAGIVGDRGVPVILVSGDDKACREARELLPWAVTAQVKEGVTWRGGMLLPPGRAYGLLREKTMQAVGSLSRMKPCVYPKPVVLRCEVTERQDLPRPYAKPYMRILGGRTYEVEGATMEEALFRL